MSRVRFRGDRHTRNNAKPISMYKIVHTGANTTFGGLNQGLFNKAYHAEIELTVNTEDPNPANKGAARGITSLTTSMIFILARCRFAPYLVFVTFQVYDQAFKKSLFQKPI